MNATVTAALISGQQYDRLYQQIDTFERHAGVQVRIAFRGEHPELNAHLRGFDEPPYDLVSTHTKYAPSQRSFLAPLDSLVNVEDYFPAALDLARINGSLFGIPRNIDVRLLHYRTDLLEKPPATWDELLARSRHIKQTGDVFPVVFTGKESGLFGTFFELVEMAGVRLFPDNLIPQLCNDGGRWALELLRTLLKEGLAPAALLDFHYDEAHEFFRNGHAAMICDWPGYFGLYTDPTLSRVAGRFAVARMPAGPGGRWLAYGGAHTFALTRHGAANPAAVSLLQFLTSPERQLLEAAQGSVPVRRSVMDRVRANSEPCAAVRWELLEDTIQSHVLIPPKLSYYPAIEDILWHSVQDAISGRTGIDAALTHMETKIAEQVRQHA